MKIRQTKILGLALLLGGLALCGVGLWLLLSPAQYRAMVSIYPKNEGWDERPSVSDYIRVNDIMRENIRSPYTLSNVVEKLNLNEVWGRKYQTGVPLDTTTTIQIIRSRTWFAPVRDIKVIAITYSSEDPNEVAQIVNAIAEAFEDFRNKCRRETISRGLEIMQQQYQEEKKQISLQQTNNEQMLALHRQLGAKIEAEKLELEHPRASLVQIVDRAEPPQSPAGSNHPLGAALFAIGLFPLLGGILLLKPSRHPAV